MQMYNSFACVYLQKYAMSYVKRGDSEIYMSYHCVYKHRKKSHNSIISALKCNTRGKIKNEKLKLFTKSNKLFMGKLKREKN